MGIPLETYSNTFVHIVKGLNSLNYTRIGAYICYFILIDIAITKDITGRFSEKKWNVS